MHSSAFPFAFSNSLETCDENGDVGSTSSFERVNVEATDVTQIDLVGDLRDKEWVSILEVRTVYTGKGFDLVGSHT